MKYLLPLTLVLCLACSRHTVDPNLTMKTLTSREFLDTQMGLYGYQAPKPVDYGTFRILPLASNPELTVRFKDRLHVSVTSGQSDTLYSYSYVDLDVVATKRSGSYSNSVRFPYDTYSLVYDEGKADYRLLYYSFARNLQAACFPQQAAPRASR